MVKPDTARKLPPRKLVGSTTTSTNVLRAKALEMISSGSSVEAAAKAVGRSADTVRDWQRAIAPAIEARLAAVTDAIADGAVEAKRIARDHAPEAIRTLIREMREGPTSAERRAASVALLDRGGVPPKSEHEIAPPSPIPPIVVSIETARALARRGMRFPADGGGDP